MKVQINNSKFLGGAMLVTASVHHTNRNEVTAETLAAELQAVTKNALYVLAGSFNVIEEEPRRTIVRGFMIPAKNAIPFNESTRGFTCLSGSMYQDEKDELWNLQRSENGQYLVRANNIEDPAELAELMQSCSSAISVGKDQSFFKAVASAQAASSDFSAGDYVQYQKDGALHFGFALANVDQEGEEMLAVVNASDDTLDVIAEEQVVGFAQDGYQIPDTPCLIPDDMRSLSSSGENEHLVEYYRKVYGFNPLYWEKLESILANHRFM